MKGVPADLSSEDALRLQVLVTNADAVRIDESTMVVYGLQGDQQMQVRLNPTCRDDKYLTLVRQMLSGTVLGSPGGYPVFLRRWTRMGALTNAQLDKLLMLGEPEAALAVVRAPSLTESLARKAWWASGSTEVGRCMLQNPAIVATSVGPEIAEFLLEYLPFETEHRDMIETIRLVLQPGLLSEERRLRLWESGRAKGSYRLGFLLGAPDDLPSPVEPHPALDACRDRLQSLAEAENAFAQVALKTLGRPGQTFLAVAAEIIRRPANQDVVSEWLNAVGAYFAPVRQHGEERRELGMLFAEAETLLANPPAELRTVLESVPELRDAIEAMLVLAQVDEAVVTPIFALTDAVGTVMRKKVEPVTGPIMEQLQLLRGSAKEVWRQV